MNSDELTQKLTQIILQNLNNEQFGVKELSEQVGISRSHLHRKLKLYKNKSISQFISELRLNEALKLLKKGEVTVSEAAYQVGFSSPSYFNSCFHKHYGFSPGDVKNKDFIKISRYHQNKHIHSKDDFSSIKKKIIPLIVLFLIIISTASIFYIKNEKSSVKEKSIAILPFDNLSSNKENQYFADGLVEDLLNRLSRIDNLKVISRTSSEVFREKGNRTSPEIAKILGVNYILEGSVQPNKDKVRINVQLIDALSDNHLWAENYDKELKEIFDLQGEIASNIAQKLSIIVSEQEKAQLKYNSTINPQALEYYYLGCFHLDKRTEEEISTGLEYYRKAIIEDPYFALGYAGLADGFHISALYGNIDWETGKDSAFFFASKALKMDKSLAEAHTVLGGVYLMENDIESAEEEFLKAINLNENYPYAYQYYASMLRIIGKQENVRELINHALELDPLSFINRMVSCYIYDREGDYKMAYSEYKKGKELVPEHNITVTMGFILNIELGNINEALESFKSYCRLTNKYSIFQADSAFEVSGIDGLLKMKAEATNIVDDKARYYAMLGEKDKALDALEMAYNENSLVAGLFTRYWTKDLHSSSRFLALKKKVYDDFNLEYTE